MKVPNLFDSGRSELRFENGPFLGAIFKGGKNFTKKVPGVGPCVEFVDGLIFGGVELF